MMICPYTLGLFDGGLIPSWRELAKAVHAHGLKVAAQLLAPGLAGTSSRYGESLLNEEV